MNGVPVDLLRRGRAHGWRARPRRAVERWFGNPRLAALSALVAGATLIAPVPAQAAEDFGEMIGALETRNLTAEEIRVTEEIERLEVVRLGALTPDQILTLEDVLDNTEDGFAEVQTAIAANELLGLKLEQRSIEISRVFAATRTEDGIVTVYLRGRNYPDLRPRRGD